MTHRTSYWKNSARISIRSDKSAGEIWIGTLSLSAFLAAAAGTVLALAAWLRRSLFAPDWFCLWRDSREAASK